MLVGFLTCAQEQNPSATSAQVAASGYWSQVHTVQVTLTFTTQFGNQVGQAQSTTWVQNIGLKNQS